MLGNIAERLKQRVAHNFVNGHPLLKFEIRILGWLGLYTPEACEENVSLKRIFRVYRRFLFALSIIFMLTLIGDLYVVRNNIILLGEDLCIIIGFFLIMQKSFNFMLKFEDIKEMVQEIEMLIVPDDPDDDRFEHRRIQIEYIFTECALTSGFHCLSIVLFLTLLLTPSSKNGLPFSAFYPFEISYSPVHELMYAYQGFAMLYALGVIVAVDCVTGVFWHQLAMQFEILNEEFNRIEDYCSARISSPGRVHTDRLRVLIGRHQHLFELVTKLNRITSSMLTAQVLASNFMICLTGFEATLTLDKKASFFKFFMHLNSAMSQLLFWCTYGDMVRSSSLKIATAAFSSAWYQRDQKYIKMISFVVARAQKPVNMKAGYMYILNLQTFVSILSGSYSYFALLQSLADRNEVTV